MNKHPISFLGGVLAGALTGALAMYYLDTRSGARRRRLVRDKLVAAGHDLSGRAEAKSKRALGRIKGMLVTHRLDRVSQALPQSDQQLHDRIRSRLGRVVRYPKAVEVFVDQGNVRLRGHVLRREMDDLCREVLRMAGVRGMHSDLYAHHAHEEIARLYSNAQPKPQVQRPTAPATAATAVVH
jgi:gas vesicle protein